jgi:hypothetical protein
VAPQHPASGITILSGAADSFGEQPQPPVEFSFSAEVI